MREVSGACAEGRAEPDRRRKRRKSVWVLVWDRNRLVIAADSVADGFLVERNRPLPGRHSGASAPGGHCMAQTRR